MASRVATWLGVLGLVLLAGACGKSEGSAGEIPRDELPSRVASLLCESVGSCCQRAGAAIDVAQCKRAMTAELEDELFQEQGQEAGLTYDAQAAGDCLAQVGPRLVCGELESDVPACERIFRGTLALGQPCTSSRQCKPSEGRRVTCTSEDDLGEPLVCTALELAQRGKEGEACNTTCYEGEECSDYGAVPVPAPGVPVPTEYVACYRDDGLYCSGMGTCAPLAQQGFACSDYAACVGDAFCDFQTHLCSAPRDNGAPCQGDDECRSGNCSYDDVSGTCVAEETISAEECAEIGNDEQPGVETSEPLPEAPMPGGL